MPSAPRVIVTRPYHDALRWVADLQAHGFDAEALPLIDIRPATLPGPLHAAWRRIAGYQAAMFVSGNAVNHFFAARPRAAAQAGESAPLHHPNRAWATGPGTLAALLQSGMPDQAIDAPPASAGQFDSETLWRIVSADVTPASRVLIVRGGEPGGAGAGRSWFSEQLGAAGAHVDFVVAYERHPPQFTAVQTARAREAARDGSVWLLSSSEAVAHLAPWLPEADLATARAVATHPRIAQAARNAGFGVVCESRPTLEDVIASIESLA